MIGTTRDAGRVMAALAKRYAPPSWALLSQLGSGTGWARGRYADAVALGLWPSRGIDLHGFEVKVHRGDWLRELKKPEKADEIAVYCDFWWLVVGAPDVVDLARDPIPTTWGVLELDGRGLVQRRKAERNAGVVAIDKPLVAAIFRRASEDMMPRSSIHAALDEKWDEGRKAGRSEAEGDRDNSAVDASALRTAVAEFEAASGVKINGYAGRMTGERFRAAEKLNAVRTMYQLERARQSLAEALDRIEAARVAVVEVDPSTDAPHTDG